MTEQQERQRVIDEARTWLGTPWVHMGRTKNDGKKQGGVDCGMFLIEVFHRCGFIENIDPGYYPKDWSYHKHGEMYLNLVAKKGRPITKEELQPGDVILYKFGRVYSHGAIVLDFPTIIHSYIEYGGVTEDTYENPHLKYKRNGTEREKLFFSYWGKEQ